MTTLTNGSLTLRSPEPSDAEAVASAARSSFEELAPWMPWASEDYDVDDAMFWITNENETSFVILDDQQMVIGTCGLNGLDAANKRANLGYWVRSDRTGHGVASAAAKIVARHGLVDLGLIRLEVVMAVENAASRRVAERAGATYEGVLHNRLLLDDGPHNAYSFSITSVEQLG